MVQLFFPVLTLAALICVYLKTPRGEPIYCILNTAEKCEFELEHYFG